MAILKVDTITSADQASVSVTDGLVVSGVTTFTNGMTASGDINCGVSTFFADKSTGNVGVGTITPTSADGHTLEVFDVTCPTFRLNDGGQYKSLFQLRGNDLEIRGSNGNVELYTGNADGASSTERFRINSGGQISIRGTSTAFDTTGDLDSLQIYYETDSGQASIGPYSSGGSTHLSFYTNASAAAAVEKLRIASDGKIGIGTLGNSSPTASLSFQTGASGEYFLDVKGTSTKQFGFFYDQGSWNSSIFRIDEFDNSGNATPRIAIKGEAVSMGDLAYDEGHVLNLVSNGYDGLGVYRHSNNASSPLITLGKSRGSAGGSTTVVQNDDFLGRIAFDGADGDEMHTAATIECHVDAAPGNNDMPGRIVFQTVPDGSTSLAERMRIKSDGEVAINVQAGVAYDTDSLFVNGPSSSGKPTVEFHGNGNNSPQADSCTLHIKQNCTSAPDTAAALKITHTNPLASGEGAMLSMYTNIGDSTAERAYVFHTTGRIIQNRPNNDGSLISFRHGNTEEGSISISGSTVSYNGGHLSRWSQFVGLSTTSKADRPTIYQGTVLSNLDAMCEWPGEENQQLNKTKVSDTVGDKDVAGVFWTWDDDDDEYVNDFYVAMTGDMVIRVAGSTTVARGDLLESAGDGTAKPQSDDIVRSKTIAKIISTTSTATYADGSKAYPCVLMAC